MLATLVLVAHVWVNPAPAQGPGVGAAPSDASVRAAITAVLQRRMGADTEILIDDLRIHAANLDAVVDAVPDPGTRLDRPVHFILRGAADDRSSGRLLRVGEAHARVRMRIGHAHTGRSIARGSDITAADVVGVHHEVTSGLLRPWPTLQQVVGSRANRDLPPNVCVGPTTVASPPAVRSGEGVVAVSRSFGVEVSAVLVAAENGELGSVIRVVNQQSRRHLKARVVSAGVVEIIHD